MATISIGNAGVANTITNLVGNNAVTNALGISTLAGGIGGPSVFATKFGKPSIFSVSSLPFTIRTGKNFTVDFHWFPKFSQIRSYLANAFAASDTDEIQLFVQKVDVPDIRTEQSRKNGKGHFQCAMPLEGVNGAGQLKIYFLSTEFSLVDHCFYQWLRETESPYWIYGPTVGNTEAYGQYKSTFSNIVGKFGMNEAKADAGVERNKFTYTSKLKSGITVKTRTNAENLVYDGQPMDSLIRLQSTSQSCPFTRADIEIKYYSDNMKELHSVICYGAYPTRIETMNVEQNYSNFSSSFSVDFDYDSIDVVSPFIADSSSNGAITGTVNSIASSLGSNSAAWTTDLTDSIALDYLNKSWLAKASRMVNSATNKAGSKLASKINSVQKNLGVGMA